MRDMITALVPLPPMLAAMLWLVSSDAHAAVIVAAFAAFWPVCVAFSFAIDAIWSFVVRFNHGRRRRVILPRAQVLP